MNKLLERKRVFSITALSLVFSLSAAMMSVEASEHLSGGNNPGGVHAIMRNAIKIDKQQHLRSRILSEDEEDNSQDEDENSEEDSGEEDDEEEENSQEDEDEEEDQEEEDEDGEEDAEEEENDDADEEENEDEAENDDAGENNEYNNGDEDGEEEYQIEFVKCVAFNIEPNLVDVEAMLANGQIDEDGAYQLEKTSLTTTSTGYNTQESVVFFTYGNALYMVSINDWIAASSGYEQTCNAIDDDDVETVFATVPSLWQSSVEQYADHVWYSGFNCKADGTGFKAQLFLDETCNAFSPVLNSFYPFQKATNTTQYSTKVASDQTNYMGGDAKRSVKYAQYCDGSEFCEKVLENSIQFGATCGEENERKLATSYHLDYDAASNIQNACSSIKYALHVQDGYYYSLDELESKVLSWSNKWNGGQEFDRRPIIPGTDDALLMFILFVAWIILGLYFLFFYRSPDSRSRKEDICSDDESDTKREPLVDKTTSSDKKSDTESDTNSDSETNKAPSVGKKTLTLPKNEPDIPEAYSAIECTLSKKFKLGKKHTRKHEKKEKKVLSPRGQLKPKKLDEILESSDSYKESLIADLE